jgi:hypothetical protein
LAIKFVITIEELTGFIQKLLVAYNATMGAATNATFITGLTNLEGSP